MKKSQLFTLFFHILFCLAVVLSFRYNSYLRPAALGALYKEYIAASIVLSLCYLNYFVLYPLFYVKRRFLIYIILTLLSLITFSLAEEALVYPQVYGVVHLLDINLNLYFIEQTILIMLRDACFVLFSFSLSIISSLKKENKDIYLYLHNHNHLIVAKDTKNNTVTIHLDDITYCQQIENYAYINLSNGMQYSKNCSLSALAEELGTDYSVRISRSIIAMYVYVQSYDINTVYLCTNEGVKGFAITQSYKNQAIIQLKKHCPISEDAFDTLNALETPAIVTNQSSKTLIEKDEDSISANSANLDEKRYSYMILSFITGNPDCKGSDITQFCGLSLSTVNRILAQLKEEGLVEYVGSKKTGGYRAVGVGSGESEMRGKEVVETH